MNHAVKGLLLVRNKGANALVTRQAAFFSTSNLQAAVKRREADRTKSSSFVKKGRTSKQKGEDAGEGGSAKPEKNSYYYKAPKSVELEVLTPEKPSSELVNKILELDSEVIRKIGLENLPKELLSSFETLNNTGLLFRKESLEILEKVKGSAKATANNSLIIDGKSGTGKSVLLLQSVLWALNSGYFVVYASQTNNWVDSSQAYSPSASDPSVFLQNNLVSRLLNSIGSLNDPQITKNTIKTEKNIVIGKETIPAGTSLDALITYGVRYPSVSHGVLDAILKIVTQQTQVPVLIAIDQVNTLFSPTSYTDLDHKPIHASQLKLVSSFLPFFSNPISNGICIGASSKLDSRFQPSFLIKDSDYDFTSPSFLNTNYTTRSVSPNVSSNILRVNSFDFAELSVVLSHYYASALLNYEPSQNVQLKFWSTTSGNPSKLFKACTRYDVAT